MCDVHPDDQIIDIFNGHFPDAMTHHDPFQCEAAEAAAADKDEAAYCDDATLEEEDLAHLDTLVLSTAGPTPSPTMTRIKPVYCAHFLASAPVRNSKRTRAHPCKLYALAAVC